MQTTIFMSYSVGIGMLQHTYTSDQYSATVLIQSMFKMKINHCEQCDAKNIPTDFFVHKSL